jgi:hypothetical protein
MNFTTWWAQNEPSERYLGDWTHADLREFARKAWNASQAMLGPRTASAVQRACDRCSQGVMDADRPDGRPGNDHLYGRCRCECHEREQEWNRREELSGAQ